MRKVIPPDPAALNRRPSTVEAEPSAGTVFATIDGERHRLAPDEARAIGRALLQAARLAGPPLDLDDGDEMDDGDGPGF